jgi:uncharacterized protein (TIGR02246 family)
MKDQNEILALFEEWNNALLSGDASKVASLYAENAILLPTVSNKVRHNHSEIRDYFEHFLQKNPSGKIIEPNIRLFEDMAINSGIYHFSLNPNKNESSIVKARYTFVYRKMEGKWLIVEHHSSAFPEL